MLRWGEYGNPLGKRDPSDRKPDNLIQAAKAERVGSVISNCTGLEVFFLHDNCACSDAVAVGDITNLQLDEIAGPELAVDA